MKKYHMELIDEEEVLVETIDLCVSHANRDEAHVAYRRPILALLQSLCERGAIPEERLKYWNDPDYNTHGRKMSHKGVFERNGCTGEDIYTHPHFIPYLRYFLFGADVPDVVIRKFEAKVGNPNWVTSGDIVPIGKCARDLTRQYRLDRLHAAEEFFKLCLDMELGLSTAAIVRRSVMQLR